MVAPKSRLPYEEFRTHGYREVATPYFSVKARRNSLKQNRCGVIVSVSSAKKAVRRNFLRRQAKSTLLKIPQEGFDFFVVVRRRAALSPKNIFKKELHTAITSLIPRL